MLDFINSSHTQIEYCKTVENTKLIAADFEQFEKAFPKLNLSNDSFKHVLLSVGSVLSETQIYSAPLNLSSKKIKFGNDRIRTYRPQRYGRAALVNFSDTLDGNQVGSDIIFDVKGCGVKVGAVPQGNNHGTGLLFLHDAILEYINSKILNKISIRSDGLFRVLPHFGIVDLGFSISFPKAKKLPVCTIIRSPSFRDIEYEIAYPLETKVPELQMKIEKFLQRFGISSIGRGYDFTVSKNQKVYFEYRNEGKKFIGVDKGTFERVFGLTPPMNLGRINIQLCGDMAFSGSFNTLTDLTSYRDIHNLYPHFCMVHAINSPSCIGLISDVRRLDCDYFERRYSEKFLSPELSQLYGHECKTWWDKSPLIYDRVTDSQLFSLYLSYCWTNNLINTEDFAQKISNFVDICWKRLEANFKSHESNYWRPNLNA